MPCEKSNEYAEVTKKTVANKTDSTVITMTRLTRETALRGILHRYMIPNISKVIKLMVNTVRKAEMKSKPRRMNTITNTAASEIPV